jgi:hypothetical protein
MRASICALALPTSNVLLAESRVFGLAFLLVSLAAPSLLPVRPL